MAEKKEKERSVQRIDPFAELEQWRPFDWRPFWGPLFGREGRSLLEDVWGRGARGPVPSVDITEDDGNYVVTAELPGVKREDVNVELEEDVLTIRGEKRSEREEKGERSRRVERSYGSFVRCFALPADADAERIEASFRDGVLQLVIPRTGERKAQPVAIKAG